MQRLALLIAILLAFAATAGMTTGHAHRYVATPIVVLNHVDAENQPIRVTVNVQRGEIDLGAGIVMPCGYHLAVAVAPPCLPPAPEAEETAEVPAKTFRAWSGSMRLRPPIKILA
ncbi:hypothetical protein VW35_08980 [Devosia soli]|uniref:Uncharacterized protein n=1 Tax=Devosia soli TaxID=361041 RepID=A0A0F5L8E8_9HYPH|nr:hypothetical protein [Devosia soli]KKB78651.1 hypothetical protein VW35_08980 [Devosia soli]